MGKLVVLEGLDGSGKSTQYHLLCQRLEQQGKRFRPVTFPDYEQPYSAPVRMYLNGDFGTRADGVDAYAAATFFAVDRLASYLRFWKEDYQTGVPVLAARYTTANMYHQACKLPSSEQDAFTDWLADFEYGKLKLPRPDKVLLLDVPPRVAVQMIDSRHEAKDIHEKDADYLQRCYETALRVAERQGWTLISCLGEDGSMADIPTVAQRIWEQVESFFV